jgi:hypothetical protein
MKWLHTLGSIAVAAITIASPALQGAVMAHPAIAAALAAVYAILGQFAPHATAPAGGSQ